MRTARWNVVRGLAPLILALAIADTALAQRAVPPPEATWPHTMMLRGATVTISAPQAISWPDHRTLTARAAISLLRPNTRAPILGTIEVSASTETDYTTRSVVFYDLKLVSSRFSSVDAAEAAQIDERIRELLPAMGAKRVPLDAVLLSLKSPPTQPKSVALNNDPPAIFHSASNASLVVFNGEPVMAPVTGTTLTFAVNTNWDVFFDADGKIWYLLDNSEWLAAPAYAGPWQAARALPPAFKALPADKTYDNVRKSLPLKLAKPGGTPTIFVSAKPAEIIVTSGAPQFAPIAGTGLQYVKNTGSDLFFMPATSRFYFLTSGRWFASAGLQGPWTFATTELPPDFARIPPTSPKGHVLVSVPGTPQAQQAIVEAQVPHQGTLVRSAVKVEVTYAGTPEFKPIPATTLTYGVNTAYQVIGAGGKYYVCYQGAWFVGPAPVGPWVLADSVPPEIYTIPPNSPLYNVTYVTVYAATPTTITYGYTTGYTLGYVSAGVVVYGTGYYYPPYYYPAPIPVFIPYPYSYAGSTWYNPTTGAWARGGTIYGPYGGAASGGSYYNPNTGAYARGGAIYGPNGGADAWSYYNPTSGTYAHGSASWGPDGGTGHASFDNPTTGRSGSTTQNWNQYERWGSSTLSGPNQTINTKSASNAQGSAGAFQSSTGAEGAGVKGAGGNSAGVVKGAGGNTYAGADGNVYKHTDDGWSKYNDGSWTPVKPPTSTDNKGSGTQGQGTAAQNASARQQGGATPTTQTASQNANARQQGGATPTTQTASQRGQASARATSSQGEQGERENYNQLEQDRGARTQGFQRQQTSGAFRGSAGGGARRR